jgi:DNA-binding NarL/FixJ family response regulator
LPEPTAATVLANRAVLALLRGRLVDAEADARLCARLVNRMDRGNALSAWMLAVLAHVLVMRGNLAEAEDALDPPPAQPAVDIPTAMATYHGAFVPLAAGRLDDAAQLFAATGAWCDAQQLFNPALFCWRSDLARILVRLDRRDEAHELASAELRHSQAVQSAGLVGQSLVTLGIVEGAQQGIARISEGVALLAKSQLTSAYVEGLIALGAELRRLRRPSQAREPLRAALDLAERGGLGLLASEAEAQLRATGARPRRRTLRGVDALTASEQRVARLAAQGLTNRAIAQALFLSPKTVERHLGQIYSKLEITGRAELAAVLNSAG